MIIFIVFLYLTTQVFAVEKSMSNDYHAKHGITLGKEIKQWEDQYLTPLVDIASYPYQAGLIIELRNKNMSVCGATLFSHDRLVTAAHCRGHPKSLNFAVSFIVVVGSNFLFKGGLRVKTTDCVIHPSFLDVNAYADIAVIRIPKIEFTNEIKPIKLPINNDFLWNYDGLYATVTGFEYKNSGLKHFPVVATRVPVVSDKACSSYHGKWFGDDLVCSEIAACSANYGDPLVIEMNKEKILIGVKSMIARKGCEDDKVAAFTRISTFVDWMLSI